MYVTDITSQGFSVREMNNGNHSVEITWIAVADRVDAINAPKLPSDMASPEFKDNFRKFMFNESIQTRNAQPMWWDGQRLRFDKIPQAPMPNKSKEEALQNSKIK